jgi:hypothetical protein
MLQMTNASSTEASSTSDVPTRAKEDQYLPTSKSHHIPLLERESPGQTNTAGSSSQSRPYLPTPTSSRQDRGVPPLVPKPQFSKLGEEGNSRLPAKVLEEPQGLEELTGQDTAVYSLPASPMELRVSLHGRYYHPRPFHIITGARCSS